MMVVGNAKSMGPKAFIEKAEEVIPDKIDLVFHVIAKHIIAVASSSTTPKALKDGCCKYALVYISLALCSFRYAVVRNYNMLGLKRL